MNLKIWIFVFFTGALILPSFTLAQTMQEVISERVKNSSDHNYLSLSYENDLIGGGTDEYYTSGLRITYFDVETMMPAGIDKLA